MHEIFEPDSKVTLETDEDPENASRQILPRDEGTQTDMGAELDVSPSDCIC
jgi:hypothetical protein